jgi:selenocysteine lyase/cysteine desulfurase
MLTPHVRANFSPEGAYLDSATYGLPPRRAFAAFSEASDEWRHGRCGFDRWVGAVDEARGAFARIVGTAPAEVAVGSVVSPFVGLIAASLPAGAEVLAPEEEYTSVLFPFLAQEQRGVKVRLVPLERLAEAIDARTDWVAFSAVQSLNGRVAPLAEIAAAAAHHGARTLVDATQAVGWLPFDASAFDVTATGGYKWLLNPRGTAFMTIRPQLHEQVLPHAAGWCAAEEPTSALYGAPLRLAPDARRYDISPAWLNWVGAVPALELIERVGVARIGAHDVALANLFRAGMGLAPGDSAIVSVPAPEGALQRLLDNGVRASGRGGRVRLAFHLYNDERDVERALDALRDSRPASSGAVAVAS